MPAAAVKPRVGYAVGIPKEANCARERDRHVLVVCTGDECAHAGSQELLHELQHECRHSPADVRIGASQCMGHCQLAPAMMVNGKMLGAVSPRRLRSELHRLGITA